MSRGRVKIIDGRAIHDGKEPSPVVRALAELGFPVVITTNYDQLLENAFVAAGRNPRVLIYGVNFGVARRGWQTRRERLYGRDRPDVWTAYERLRDPSPESPVILKVHGDIGHPETIVVTEEDYIRMANQISSIAAYFEAVGLEAPRRGGDWLILIMGYSMLDFDFRQVVTLYLEHSDELDLGLRYAVDYAPDALLSAFWEREWRMQYIRSNIWDFVPDLYRLVFDREMPNWRLGDG